MATFSWWRSWRVRQTRSTQARARRAVRRGSTRLLLEQLEERALLNSIPVTSLADSGAGTLRAAIAAANPGDSIYFTVTGSIDLQSTLNINEDIEIDGPGADSLTVERAAATPFSIVSVASGAFDVSISGMTIAHGDAGGGSGGGILNGGSLTVANCTLTNNSAHDGGAIGNSGYVLVTNCTFVNNNAHGGNGGGIASLSGGATIIDSAFTGNSADLDGGGIYDSGGGSTIIVRSILNGNFAADGAGIYKDSGFISIADSTIANNFAYGNGGGIDLVGELGPIIGLINCTVANNGAFDYRGGGIANLSSAPVGFSNTIIAGNFSADGPDVFGAVGALSSNNLVGDGSDMTGISNATQGNQVGTADNRIDPLLGAPADNGGPTQTMALLPGSPAIDAGSNQIVEYAVDLIRGIDQRGLARIANGTVDIGAFESRGFTIAVTSGNHQSATVKSAFLDALQATVSSPYGEPVAGGVVTFTGPDSPVGASLDFGGGSSQRAPIDPLGHAIAFATANTTAGNYAVTVSARGATALGAFSMTNTPGTPTHISTFPPFTSGVDMTVGNALGVQFQVVVTDAYGNPVPGESVLFAAPNSGPSGTFLGNAFVTTDAQGFATAPTFVANTVAGSYYVSVIPMGSFEDSVAFSVTNTPDKAATFVVSGFPTPITAGVAGKLAVAALDKYGNLATGYAGTVHFASSDPQAVLPADATLTNGTGTFSATLKTAGAQSISVVDTVTAGLTGTQSAITVNPAAVSNLVIVAPTLVSPAVPFTFMVTAKDPYGNTVTGYAGTIHFTSSDKGALLPGNAVLFGGSGTFTATLKAKTTSSITATDVDNPTLVGKASIVVDPPAKTKKHARASRGDTQKRAPQPLAPRTAAVHLKDRALSALAAGDLKINARLEGLV